MHSASGCAANAPCPAVFPLFKFGASKSHSSAANYMADRHASLPTPINTTRTTNNSGQRRHGEASTPTSATTQHSGGLTAAPSPATPVNPSTPDPALFGRLVEILSANANGCIQEMGYPAVWENLVNLQKAYGELQRREMQLRQHASNLARLLQDSRKCASLALQMVYTNH